MNFMVSDSVLLFGLKISLSTVCELSACIWIVVTRLFECDVTILILSDSLSKISWVKILFKSSVSVRKSSKLLLIILLSSLSSKLTASESMLL